MVVVVLLQIDLLTHPTSKEKSYDNVNNFNKI